MKELWSKVVENGVFVLEFIAIAIGLFAISYLIEVLIRKKNNVTGKMFSTKQTAFIGMLSAVSGVLMVLDFPVLAIAPSFYKFDFSDIPALIGSFAFGPLAGVMIEFVKILVKLLIKGTSTVFIGELAAFLGGVAIVLPASVIYLWKKNKKSAIVGCIAGTLSKTLLESLFNAWYLLPAFAKLFHMELDSIIAMGTAIHASIDDVYSFVFLTVAPFNLLKGTAVSLVTVLVYKRLRKFLHA